MKHSKYGLALAALLLTTLCLAACSSVVTTPKNSEAFSTNARWALLPFVDSAEVPLAGQRAEAIAATLLRQRGVAGLTHYPVDSQSSGLPEFDDSARYASALKWAQAQGYQYGLSGTVTEWHYKTGLDGEPAVGLTLKIIDIPTGQVVWSASGARSGWGHDSLSGTAQVLMQTMLAGLQLQPTAQTQ